MPYLRQSSEVEMPASDSLNTPIIWFEVNLVFSRCHKKGALHGPYYCLTQHRQGKTKNIYIPKEHLEKISPLAERYKTYETSLTRIRNLNQQILGLLKEIEQSAFLPASRLNLKTKRQRKKEKRFTCRNFSVGRRAI